jgi:hypothetical protein
MARSVEQTSLPATEPPGGTGGVSPEGGTTERVVRRAADARGESLETLQRQLLQEAP